QYPATTESYTLSLHDALPICVNSEVIMEKVNNESALFDEAALEAHPLTHEQELLQKHFESLGEQCKKILTLFYYRGFTIQEIMRSEEHTSELQSRENLVCRLL